MSQATDRIERYRSRGVLPWTSITASTAGQAEGLP